MKSIIKNWFKNKKGIDYHKKKIKRRNKIDTSIAGFEYAGVRLSEEQFQDLVALNLQMRFHKDIPVFSIIMLLKVLGILPPKLMREVSDNKTAGDSENVSNDELQKRYGRFKA